jgi:hypothetical protein
MDLKEYKNIIAEENGRKSIADSLLAVERTEGWKIMKMIMEDEVQWVQERINDIDNMDDRDLLNKRMRLYHLKKVLDMPHTIAEGLLSAKEEDYGEPVYE